MTRYIGSRLLWACIMVLGIVIVDFLITHILPGDPVDVLVGDFPAPPEYILQVRHEFGLDRPLAAGESARFGVRRGHERFLRAGSTEVYIIA